jgi:hypothetical protein
LTSLRHCKLGMPNLDMVMIYKSWLANHVHVCKKCNTSPTLVFTIQYTCVVGGSPNRHNYYSTWVALAHIYQFIYLFFFNIPFWDNILKCCSFSFTKKIFFEKNKNWKFQFFLFKRKFNPNFDTSIYFLMAIQVQLFKFQNPLAPLLTFFPNSRTFGPISCIVLSSKIKFNFKHTNFSTLRWCRYKVSNELKLWVV